VKSQSTPSFCFDWFLSIFNHWLASNRISERMGGLGTFWEILGGFGRSWWNLVEFGLGGFGRFWEKLVASGNFWVGRSWEVLGDSGRLLTGEQVVWKSKPRSGSTLFFSQSQWRCTPSEQNWVTEGNSHKGKWKAGHLFFFNQSEWRCPPTKEKVGQISFALP